MQQIIEKINALISTLNSLPKISDENNKSLERKFLLEFNFNSNHIEGNTLTYGETKLLLMFDKTEGVHEIREYDEMRAHNVAYKITQDYAKDKEHPLTEAFIKELNRIILVKPFYKDAVTPSGIPTRRLIKVGEYKEFPNSVQLQNGEMFHYASPIDTPIKMGELINWYIKELENNELHPVYLAALLHYKFVLIHPFDDGNGRISRLLMNYVLFKNNLPPIIIKSTDKQKYLNALNQADSGNIEAFIQFIAEQLIWSLELKIKATKGENIDDENDLDKEIELLKKEISNQKQLTQKANNETICALIEHSIFPLFQKLETKLMEFKDLFFDYEKTINYHRNGLSKSLGSKDSEYSSLISKWLESEKKTVTENYIQNISYCFGLKGFKSSLDAQSISVKINIVFNEHHFIIQTFREYKLPYSNQVSNDIQNEIVNGIIKNIITNIKNF